MQKVFVDTVAWIALVNLHDSLHERAKTMLAQLRTDGRRFITSEFVLIEFANTLSSPAFRHRASVFIEGLQNSKDIDIIPANPALFSSGFDLYRRRSDKEWSLVDCISFIIMAEYSVTAAFTQDHHFEQAGFTRFL